MMLIEIIKKIPFIYKPILYFVNKRNHYKRAKAYRNHGKEALELFSKCMEDNGYSYTLAFGSILGAIREHGFIKHDLDIDTFMWIDDFSPDIIKSLQEVGFTWLCSISIQSDKYGREDTLQYKGVNIDIFYLYPAIDKYPYCCDFVSQKEDGRTIRLPRRIEIPITKQRKSTLFESVSVYIPENAEEICEFRYGPNYMTPDPKWHWESAYEAVKEWQEMKVYTNYRYLPS